MKKGKFFEGVWLGGREGKCVVGPRYFLLGFTRKFFLQDGKNIERKKITHLFFSFSSSSCCCCFFFFFSRLGLLFFFFFFPICTIHTQLFFAKKMCCFFVLFNEDIIVNLYQLYFSILSFSSQPKK